MLKIHCYSFYRLVSPSTSSIDPRLPDYADLCLFIYLCVFAVFFRTYHHCSQMALGCHHELMRVL